MRREISEDAVNSIFLIIIYILNIIQVTIQTPFIVDGIRRCSNSKRLRFSKPGKGLITFALILNIAVWIFVTFEIKSVDKYHKMQKFYGKFIWMVILDTCLPLMLFYRFHSSVCLSDIWKHAYEKDESNPYHWFTFSFCSTFYYLFKILIICFCFCFCVLSLKISLILFVFIYHFLSRRLSLSW